MNLSVYPLSVEFVFTPVANYAIQQNRIPIVRKLVIQNTTHQDVFNLEIELTCFPAFANTWTHRIEFLPPEQSIEIEVKGLNLSPTYLSEVTERLVGQLTLSILSDGNELFKNNYDVNILAYDQWNGIGDLPEMLAAFVTPNNPEIPQIVHNASVILKNWTGNPSFDAYQSLNPDRVKKQIGAIFEAIANLGIVYCTPPASFETNGQRIRMCDTILSQKLGTCVDMAILFSSCIEAIGLNPLLVIMNGHAFAGVWLINEAFADSFNYDVSLLKKRTARGINEIILVESTCMNAGVLKSFDESINEANYKLVKEGEFILFIDVKRSRLSGIKPLPQRIKTTKGWEIVDEQGQENRESLTPDTIFDEGILRLPESTIFSKQKLWERKLLDLSLRNNLLNLRITQSTIQLCTVGLNKFEDALANGEEFQILAKPEELVNPNITSGVYQTVSMSDPIVDLLQFELEHNRLRTYLGESELRSNLTNIYRASRLSLEENGANTLYLALGFLKWYETSQSELARYAPILLLPIEIVRKSAKLGYVIRSREEETIMNITLLEKLKQDYKINISGLDELPHDESGVDVLQIFNIIRRGIMSQPRWDLEEHSFLGIFSFNKFIMWNDINKNADKLKENKVVASLIAGKLEWDCDAIPSNIDLDNKYRPSEIALPISADSTQLEAICTAMEDNSFVLHGPPGTGKSQTITNIVVNALYKGKRVLFVAEKMAALSVVQKRLTEIGLAPFCLELHSTKSKKSSTLEQLQKTTEVVRKSTPLEFAAEAERLYKQRSELNEYVESLHKKHSFGFSLFDSFTGYAEYSNIVSNSEIEKLNIEGLTKEKYVEWCDIVEELQNAGTLCGHPHDHPLKEITSSSYSQKIRATVYELITQYVELLDEKLLETNKIFGLLEIPKMTLTKEKNNYLSQLAEIIVALPDMPEHMISVSHPERIHDQITELAEYGKKRDEYREEILRRFKREFLEYKVEEKLNRWNSLNKKWFLPKLLGQNKLLKEISSFSNSDKLRRNEVLMYLKKLFLYQREQKFIDTNSLNLSSVFDSLWNNGNPNWDTLVQTAETVLRVHKVLLSITEDVSDSKRIKNILSNHLYEGTKTFIEYKGKSFLNVLSIDKHQKELENNLSDLLGIDFSGEEESVDWTSTWKVKAENWQANLDSLRNWMIWNRVREKVIGAGLQSIVFEYERGRIKNEEVLLTFKKTLYKCFAEYIISKDSKLEMFNGKMFEGKIRKFEEQTSYFEELTKAEVFATLAAKIPAFTKEASSNSEIGILQRAIRNGGRGMSIRRLFDSIPNLLPRLCPCFLMSPISVAQYFEVDKSRFDLVIFDEASQMPTCEAVGAIARGQNVIVVGDPKQMPPTSFFSTNYFDEENAIMEDSESILEDCLALSIPSKYLLWHYRSRHESLIAFSNSNYYDNKLLTFPSPDDMRTKVSNVFVPGHYDRGKTRQNPFEAKAIVEEVIIRLSDPILSQKSIGIVTFSSVQQNLIEDLLNEEFKTRPNIEQIALESPEPIFIKNLENVQGDERDVILFSVGYGPDKDGKVYLNFGPLVRRGGWRRLNVAISRARDEMKVFSTLRSDQINISGTSSKEIVGIQAFLEYTERGKKALPQKNIISKTQSGFFEQTVANEIAKYGYKVQTDIGCSGFRIDMGIVNPIKESEYILGILTDGKNYLSGKTANDREIVRGNVLKLLGWNIYRLWSQDWWDNPTKVIGEIVDVIKEAQSHNMNIGNPESYVKINESKETTIKELTDTKLQGITQKLILPNRNSKVYEICELERVNLHLSDEFFDPSIRPKVIQQIKKVMKIEAPISHDLLSRRILNSWGISRLGIRLNDYLSSIYSGLGLKKIIQGDTYFYWLSEQDPNNYDVFRVPGEENQKRNAEDIAKEEIVNGIKEILNNQISLPHEDLIKEVSRLFGFTRIGGNVEKVMESGISFCMREELLLNQDGRYVLIKQ